MQVEEDCRIHPAQHPIHLESDFGTEWSRVRISQILEFNTRLCSAKNHNFALNYYVTCTATLSGSKSKPKHLLRIMKQTLRFTQPALSLFFLVLFVGVSDKTQAQEIAADTSALAPIIVQDLDASGDAVHYSLRDNRIVPGDDVTDDNWDISFQGTTILVNKEAQLIERSFETIASAPENGYRKDDAATGPAISAGNGTGWFDYDPASHIVSTIPERTIVIRTPDNTYAKVEILSYYEGQMLEVGAPRFYTFQYVHQADGSRKFR